MARATIKIRTAAAGAMPADLMAGPCIEDWADKSPRPALAGSNWLAFRALRHWSAAVDEWATSSGWATGKQRPNNARNLARTRHPWSRDFLISQGRQQLVDFYEGRRATFPKPEDDGTWRPRVASRGSDGP